MKEGIIAHDLNRYIFFFNREAEKITGYHRDEVLGKDCHDVFGGPLCGERCSFGDRKANDMEDKEYTINIVTKSGDDRRIEMAVTMMEDKKGHIIGVLASFKGCDRFFKTQDQSRPTQQFLEYHWSGYQDDPGFPADFGCGRL